MKRQIAGSIVAGSFAALLVAVAAVPSTLTVFVAASVQAQGPAPETTETFEAASIKENREPVPGRVPQGRFESLPGRFRASQATLQELIIAAYDLFDHEIFGAPSWATSDRFDVVATTSIGEPSAQDPRLRRMLRALLAERFKLVAHEERREMPIYTLVLARSDRKLGAQLRPFEGECTTDLEKFVPPDLSARSLPPTDPRRGPSVCISGIGVGRISVRGMPLSELTTMLSRLPAVRRRVLDRTGLTGKFDYDVEWTPTAAPAGVVVSNDRPSEAGPNIFTAVQEQLGLKLESGRDTFRVLVIDSVNKPSQD